MPRKDPEARRAYRKAHYLENRDKILADCAQHYRKNLEAHHAYNAAYYVKNKEAILEKMHSYQLEHREENREYKKQYYEMNKDSIRQQRAEYRKNNKEKIAARNKKRYEDNKESILRNNALSYARNIEKNKQRSAKWREGHKEALAEYRAQWRKDFPEKSSLLHHRRRARKRALPDTWTLEQQQFMLTYWHNACAACGNAKGLFWTLAHDHWIPLTSPDCPGTLATNMIPLCHGNQGCNNSKKNQEPHAWLIRRFGSKKATKIEKDMATYFAIVTERFGESVI